MNGYMAVMVSARHMTQAGVTVSRLPHPSYRTLNIRKNNNNNLKQVKKEKAMYLLIFAKTVFTQNLILVETNFNVVF